MVVGRSADAEFPINIKLRKGTARTLARQLQLAINRHQHFAGAQPLPELDALLDRLVQTIVDGV